jgi:hypothetical protein
LDTLIYIILYSSSVLSSSTSQYSFYTCRYLHILIYILFFQSFQTSYLSILKGYTSSISWLKEHNIYL